MGDSRIGGPPHFPILNFTPNPTPKGLKQGSEEGLQSENPALCSENCASYSLWEEENVQNPGFCLLFCTFCSHCHQCSSFSSYDHCLTLSILLKYHLREDHTIKIASLTHILLYSFSFLHNIYHYITSYYLSPHLMSVSCWNASSTKAGTCIYRVLYCMQTQHLELCLVSLKASSIY